MPSQSTQQETRSRTAGAPVKTKTGGRASRKSTRAAAKPEDAIKLLKADHRQVRTWFDEFEHTDDDGK